MVIASAIRTHSGEVIRGFRHYHAFHALYCKAGLRAHIGCTQGFVTDDGRFVDRREAVAYALRAGQITRAKRVLYSEDVWPHDCPEWGTRPPLWALWGDAGMSEEDTVFGWLIEDTCFGAHEWWTADARIPWSRDALRAVRFARREDALAVIVGREPDHHAWKGRLPRATEHGFAPLREADTAVGSKA